MRDDEFAISYTAALRPLYSIIALGPRFSGVRVTAQNLRVRLGWGFLATIPRASIGSVEPDTGRVTGWGVHGWGRTWLVNGSSSGVLRIELDSPGRAWVMGVPVPLRVLRVSVEQPEELRRVLSQVAT